MLYLIIFYNLIWSIINIINNRPYIYLMILLITNYIFLSLIVGVKFEPYALALIMIIIEIVFSICLVFENKILQGVK